MEDLDWYISQAGDDIHLIEKFESEESYDLYESLELDELAAPGAPPVVKGSKKLDVSLLFLAAVVRFLVSCVAFIEGVLLFTTGASSAIIRDTCVVCLRLRPVVLSRGVAISSTRTAVPWIDFVAFCHMLWSLLLMMFLLLLLMFYRCLPRETRRTKMTTRMRPQRRWSSSEGRR